MMCSCSSLDLTLAWLLLHCLTLLLPAPSFMVYSFNLEPRIPVIKVGSPHSHFGYSVAQHQSKSSYLDGKFKSWILVGAPKDHNLQPGTNRSGALWKCPLTTNTTDCTQVHTDGFKDATGRLLPPSEDEIKDDQWLGVTVKSQGSGGDVLVCAHRYMHKGRGFQWGFGRCYLLSQDLEVTETLEPCRGKPVNSGHQQYGFCQAGISGMVLEDEVVLGVPGPYTWRGTVHTSNISKNFLFRDKTQYFGPVTENLSPVDKYSYLGYSVTAGRFLGPFVSYAGGAPRSNGTGQVVFFSRKKIGESSLVVELILDGEKFASSFGFEVLGVDINNDGLDELFVGAPFYRSDHSSGAVYCYTNINGINANSTPNKLEGRPGETRFGFSMTSLGDLNRDGYQDIAVGAPYEDKGAIYIYLGSADGLVVEPAQVIRPSDLPGLSYDAFGYSLSGGMDMDGNGYPDLLTSSFCSDRVVLIRSRPVIAIETVVVPKGGPSNVDPSHPGCSDDMDSNSTCFSFEACFRMGEDNSPLPDLVLRYVLEERMYQDHPIPRVQFTKDGNRVYSGAVNRTITFSQSAGAKDHRCQREVVYLRDGVRDIIRPIRFRLSYKLVQREPGPYIEGGRLPDINEYPILDQQEAVKYFKAEFIKDCGVDDICDSDINVEASLDLPWATSRRHQEFTLGVHNSVLLKTSISNAGEPAYLPQLYVRHHESMAFNTTHSKTGRYICAPLSSTLVHCPLGNPLAGDTESLELYFKRSGYFGQRFIHFTVFANSTSNELTPQDPIDLSVEIIKKAEVVISGSVEPEQVFFSGDVVGESGLKDLKEIGAEITHTYIVENKGPWRVDYLDVDIMWPHQVENFQSQGKWLLYLSQIPIVKGDGDCRVDGAHVNALNLLPLVSSESRGAIFKKQSKATHRIDSTDELIYKTTTSPPAVHGTISRTEASLSINKSVRKETLTRYSSTNTLSEYDGESSRSGQVDESYDDNYDYYNYLTDEEEQYNPYGNKHEGIYTQSSYRQIQTTSTANSKTGQFSNRYNRLRSKRTVDYSDKETLKTADLRCTGDVPTAKCIHIRCSLRNLGSESSATIRIFSRLWNATLVEDYSHVNLVNIQSRGEIILPEELRSRQDESDDVATAETKAYANLLEQSKSVPLWVILLSIFAGLLILVIIILVMWKCGFFKRKRPGGGKY